MTAGRPQVYKCAQGSANGAARKGDIVYQDQPLTLDVKGNLRRPDFGLVSAEIIAVEGNIEIAHGNRCALDARDGFGEAAGQRGTFAEDTDDGEVPNAPILFQDLMGDASPRAPHLIGVHDDGSIKVHEFSVGGHRSPWEQFQREIPRAGGKGAQQSRVAWEEL